VVDQTKKATHLAQAVKVYSFNTKSDVWWNQGQAKFSELKASVYRFQWENIQSLSALVQRTMEFSVTTSDDSAFISTEQGECEVTWITLQIA